MWPLLEIGVALEDSHLRPKQCVSLRFFFFLMFSCHLYHVLQVVDTGKHGCIWFSQVFCGAQWNRAASHKMLHALWFIAHMSQMLYSVSLRMPCSISLRLAGSSGFCRQSRVGHCQRQGIHLGWSLSPCTGPFGCLGRPSVWAICRPWHCLGWTPVCLWSPWSYSWSYVVYGWQSAHGGGAGYH